MSTPPDEEIRNTIARYCMLCDDGRFEEWSELFAPDGRFAVMGSVHEGREDIRTFIEESMPPEVRGKHVSMNTVIEVDGWGGTASAWTDFIFVSSGRDILTAGRYHDELVRSGDKRWRFTLREIVFSGSEPTIAAPLPA